MVTETVDVSEAQRRLAELLSLARSGTDVIIVEEGTSGVRLVPLSSPSADANHGHQRVLGLHTGAIVTSDDFDEPLPDTFWLSDERG